MTTMKTNRGQRVDIFSTCSEIFQELNCLRDNMQMVGIVGETKFKDV